MSDTDGLILIDVTPGSGADFDSSFLQRIGHQVLVCHGPDHGTLCPILDAAGACEKVDAAHGIVFSLDLDRPQHRAILERYGETRGDIPIRVVVRPDQAERYAHLLEGFEVWEHEPNVAELDGFAAEVEAGDRYR